MSRASIAQTAHARSVPPSMDPAAAARVAEIKQRLNTLEARNAELVESQLRIERERAEVASAIEQATAELNAAVAAPVLGGEDPTLWLPDELLLLTLVQVALREGSWCCLSVCRRWQRVCHDQRVQHAWWNTRWEQYAGGSRQPRVPSDKPTMRQRVLAMCGAENGHVYCGTETGLIETRSGRSGALLQTVAGHKGGLTTFDGILYSGGFENTIRLWSLESGTHIRTLEGCTHTVLSLVANEVSLFSGCMDGTIRVWQRSTWNLVHRRDLFVGSGQPRPAQLRHVLRGNPSVVSDRLHPTPLLGRAL
eukprot:m.473552 g.473552  ORF g.473552 m.473552 type:complete len:307 (-) comp34522_c0_seq1:297-1217(-)